MKEIDIINVNHFGNGVYLCYVIKIHFFKQCDLVYMLNF